MLCAYLISQGAFHGSKGFLNKGSHWPAGSNHVYTDILLLAINTLNPQLGECRDCSGLETVAWFIHGVHIFEDLEKSTRDLMLFHLLTFTKQFKSCMRGLRHM